MIQAPDAGCATRGRSNYNFLLRYLKVYDELTAALERSYRASGDSPPRAEAESKDRVDAVVRLLLNKGLITEAELEAMVANRRAEEAYRPDVPMVCVAHEGDPVPGIPDATFAWFAPPIVRVPSKPASSQMNA